MEKWIEEIRAGNEDVLKERFEQYKPVVLGLRNKITLRFHDLDDWLQEGMIVFYKSVMSYSPDRGVTFGLFFKGNFERHCISLLRKEQAVKRRGDLETTHLEDIPLFANNNFQMDNDTNISDYASYVVVADQISRFDEKLSTFERHVWELYLYNLEPNTIGALLRCGEKKVKATIDRISRKFKKHLKED